MYYSRMSVDALLPILFFAFFIASRPTGSGDPS